MRILNGRMLGDSSGSYTCHKYNGSSTNDYMIASQTLVPLIHTFSVHDFLAEFSDHCIISTSVNIKLKQPKQKDNTTLTPMPDKIKFDAGLFQDILASP